MDAFITLLTHGETIAIPTILVAVLFISFLYINHSYERKNRAYRKEESDNLFTKKNAFEKHITETKKLTETVNKVDREFCTFRQVDEIWKKNNHDNIVEIKDEFKEISSRYREVLSYITKK